MSHNPIRPWRNIERRKSRQIRVGNVLVGGDAPIAVQTMTNTPTEDAAATIAQIERAAEAGADIVRVSCPTEESTAAMHEICRASPVPIVADIHFHYKRGIEAADAGAACLRINPGNIGSEDVYKRQRWSATCWRNMASPARTRWSSLPWTMPASSMISVSTNTRSQ